MRRIIHAYKGRWNMLNIADFILIGVIALFILAGAARGLVKSLFGLGSIILSLVLAFALYPVVTGYLQQSPVGDFVTESVEKMLGERESVINEGASAENDPEAGSAEEGGLPEIVQDTLENTGEAVKETASAGIAAAALNIISLLAVFIIVRLVLWIAATLLDIVTKLPVIHGCNKLLGAVMGGVSGLLIVYLLLGLLTFTNLLNTTTDFGRTVQSSLLLSQMYENNIILYFLKTE